MKTIQKAYSPKREIAILLLLLSLKTFFQFLILEHGFRVLSSDDFVRALYGYNWAQNSFLSFKIMGWPSQLQFWLVGFSFKIWPNLYYSSIMVNTIFSTLSALVLYLLAKSLFNQKVAMWSVAIVACLPWSVWLSLSVMPEPVFTFFIISGVYLYIERIKRERLYLFLSAFCFLFASMLRAEGWTFCGAFSLLLLFQLINADRKEYIKKSDIILAIGISSAFILFFLTTSYIKTGSFLQYSGVMKKSYLSVIGRVAPLYLRVFRYPAYLFMVSPIISIVAIHRIVHYVKKREVYGKVWNYLYFILFYFIGLVGSSVTSGADPTAAPQRLVVICIIMLVPIMVDNVFSSAQTGYKKSAYTVLLLLVLWNIGFSFNHKRGYYNISLVGKYVDNLWKTGVLEANDSVIVEKSNIKNREYDRFALMFFSNHPDNCFYDQLDYSEDNFIFSKRIPLLSYDEDELVAQAEKHNIKIIVLISEKLIRKFAAKFTLEKVIGGFAVFSLNTKAKASHKIQQKLNVENRLDINYNNEIKLIGYNLQKTLFQDHITLFWKSLKKIDKDYRIIMQLKNVSNGRTFRKVEFFRKGTSKTSQWKKEEIVEDRHDFYLKHDAESGSYIMSVGLFSGDEKNLIPVVGNGTPKDKSLGSVGEISLLYSKRMVLRNFLGGNFTDKKFVSKVLFSLF